MGDFIVKALDSVHFKIVSNIDQINDGESADFFAPKFLHWIFGEKEEIKGYEGLNITFYLSAKKLIPLVEIKYNRKAPAFAAIDNLEEMFKKHFGADRIYFERNAFASVLSSEQKEKISFGNEFTTFKAKGDNYNVRKIGLGSNESFTA